MKTKSLLLIAALLFLSPIGCKAESAEAENDSPRYVTETELPEVEPPPELDVPYVPTPETVVETMLSIAEVGPGDTVFDLGCGDGRIVIAATRDFGAGRGVCVEIDPLRLEDARENAEEAGVADRIRFVEGDLFETDFTGATVVAMYLLLEVNLKLRPRLLRELDPGTRVVSHDFHMGDWEPEETVRVPGSTVYYWTIPEVVPEELLESE